eukprot:4110172-Alexandrium_andersonii.AAC.1
MGVPRGAPPRISALGPTRRDAEWRQVWAGFSHPTQGDILRALFCAGARVRAVRPRPGVCDGG